MKKRNPNNAWYACHANQRGITLIALVITIIVLLILAGVTINLTIGENGIFKTAQLAAKNYTNAQEKELAELAEFNNTLNETIKGEEKVQLVTEITLNKTEISIGIGSKETLAATITPTNATNKNLTWTSSNTDVATVSEGTITALAAGTTTITATAKDGSGKSASCNVTVNPTLASKAQAGDYVEYNGGNGYTGLWQVLYNDSTYGLQIISADTVTDSFTLGGSTEAEAKASYNNAVDTLNIECRKYVNRSYATSGRCVGSNPLSPDDPANMSTVTLGFTYNGTTASGCKVADENYTSDYNAMQIATSQNTSGIYNLGKNYWLASRYVISNSGDASFSVRYVYSDGNTVSSNLWRVDSGGSSYPYSKSRGLRPVITLKSGIQTSSGDGSETNAYKLVAQ